MIRVVLDRASNPGRPGEVLYYVELLNTPVGRPVVVSRACSLARAVSLQAAWEVALDEFKQTAKQRPKKKAPPDSLMKRI